MCAPATCCDIPALHACSHHGARTGVPGSDVHAGGNMLLMGWAQYNRFKFPEQCLIGWIAIIVSKLQVFHALFLDDAKQPVRVVTLQRFHLLIQVRHLLRCSIKLKQKTRLWLRLRLRQFIFRANSPCCRSESTRSRLWLDANTAPVDRRLSFGERMNVGGMAEPETLRNRHCETDTVSRSFTTPS